MLLGSVGSPGGAAALKEAGFEAWLLKPIRRTTLFDTLIRSVRGRTEAMPRPAVAQKPASRVRARLLIVDDSRVNRDVLMLPLRRAGCRCDVASNGEEAIAAIERENYDLVFMDCQMPVMDGYQATARIRALGGAKGLVPIVAVTAGVLQGNRQRCLDAGMNDFVGKPFRSAEILSVLNRFVAGGEE